VFPAKRKNPPAASPVAAGGFLLFYMAALSLFADHAKE